MICYVLAMGKQHLGPHVVVGYGIKIFWLGLFITSPDHVEMSATTVLLRLALVTCFPSLALGKYFPALITYAWCLIAATWFH